MLKFIKVRKKYLSGVFWLFADKGIKFLAELLVGFYIARYLGSEQFGALNFAISFVLLFHGISTLGLNEVLVRELVQNNQFNSTIISTAFLMRIVASLCLILVIQFFTRIFASDTYLLISIISISLFFRSFEVLIPYFQSMVKSEWVAFAQIAVTCVGTILKIIAIGANADLIWFSMIYLFEWIILSSGLLFIYLQTKNWSWQYDKKWLYKLLSSSWYLIISAAAVNVYMRIDQVMIKQMIGDSANGYYAAAVRLSEIWYIIPSILCAVFFPAIINAKKISADKYESQLLIINAFLFWLAFGVSLMITPFSDSLVNWLYGAEYQTAGEILKVHIWTSIFVFMGVSSGYWLIVEGHERFSLFRTISGLALNIVLNIMLIPIYGAVGAAISGLCGQALASIISMLLRPATRNIIFIQFKSILYPFYQGYIYIKGRN